MRRATMENLNTIASHGNQGNKVDDASIVAWANGKVAAAAAAAGNSRSGAWAASALATKQIRNMKDKSLKNRLVVQG